jgi:hypothetical protein
MRTVEREESERNKGRKTNKVEIGRKKKNKRVFFFFR